MQAGRKAEGSSHQCSQVYLFRKTRWYRKFKVNQKILLAIFVKKKILRKFIFTNKWIVGFTIYPNIKLKVSVILLPNYYTSNSYSNTNQFGNCCTRTSLKRICPWKTQNKTFCKQEKIYETCSILGRGMLAPPLDLLLIWDSWLGKSVRFHFLASFLDCFSHR